jgi:hypothetical protein
MTVMEICVPDEIEVVRLVSASLPGLDFHFSCPHPKIVLLKNLVDISNTGWAQMLILGKQPRCVHLFRSPDEKTCGQLDDSSLDERIDVFDMPTKRRIPLKAMLVPVLGHNPFTRSNKTTYLIHDVIAYLNELLLTGAVLFSKIS